MRTTVERMVACGDSQETIARALGIEDDTLRKHFGDELKTGYAKRRRQAVDLLFDGAAKGNASLIKRVEEMTRLAGAAADFDRPDAPRPAAGSRKVKANKLGKKEIAHDKAMVAGSDSDWGDDLRPPPNVLPN
jgi:hypothetical protein